MKSPSIKSLIETFGVVAIIVSLLFLGYESKRANDIAEAEATSTVYQAGNDFLLAVITDQNIRQILRKTFVDGSDSLTDDERMLFTSMTTYVYNIHEVAWKYNQKGLISDEDLAVGVAELCVWINGNPYGAKDWARRRDIVLSGFYEDVSRECKLTDE